MNFERAKSIILIILVGTSIFLTWSIWTYEPEYDPFEQSIDLIRLKVMFRLSVMSLNQSVSFFTAMVSIFRLPIL